MISEDKAEYILGGGIIPGKPEDSNSYRAELGGIFGDQWSGGKSKQQSNRKKHSFHSCM